MPSFDPTENVKALTAAEAQRQDDLRAAQDRLTDEKINGLIREIALRAEHAKEIRTLESDRLEKIRQVDVLAGNTAADRALVAIQTLATVQAGNAETLRSMVSSTATTVAAQLDQRMGSVTERLSALEKSSYTGMGRQAFADPAMVELLSEVKSLRESRAGGVGKSEGMQHLWALIGGGMLLALALYSRFGG